MGVISRVDASRAAREAMAVNLGDLARQGQEIRERARREADGVIADAQRTRDLLIAGATEEGSRRGQEAGYEAGLKRGTEEGARRARAEAAARMGELERALAGALSALEDGRASILEGVSDRILDLALLIARRVTRRAVECDHETALRQVEAALALVESDATVRVHVSAPDHASVAECLPGLCERFTRVRHALLVVDNSLSPGSCMVRTDCGGEIDAEIERQLDRLVGAIGSSRKEAA